MPVHLKLGNPLDPDTDIGPMISEAEAIRADSWIQEAPGRRCPNPHRWTREGVMIAPTVIVDAHTDMRVMKDELFAPAVVIHPVNSFEEGIQLADDSAYGLQAGVFTDNVDRALDATKKTERRRGHHQRYSRFPCGSDAIWRQ